MSDMPLEDDFSDIIKKARLGRGLTIAQVARAADVAEPELGRLERGRRPTRDEAARLARALELKTAALIDVGVHGWMPAAIPPVPGVETIHGDIGGYEVKGYLVVDDGSRECVIIDTGYNASRLLERLETQGLRLTAVCLTHGHSDHAGGLDRLLERWRVPVYLGAGDLALLGWQPPRERVRLIDSTEEGSVVHVGNRRIAILPTPGHTPGGLCYHLDETACFVGDTLFAGAIGRSNPFSLYPVQLESVCHLLTLPESTVLFPGHGPATTVRDERTHNPFVATT